MEELNTEKGVDKVISYLRSDFKNLAIVILLFVAWKQNDHIEELSKKVVDLHEANVSYRDKQLVESKVNKEEYVELARSYKELLTIVKDINNEKNNANTDTFSVRHNSIFNPERKLGY